MENEIQKVNKVKLARLLEDIDMHIRKSYGDFETSWEEMASFITDCLHRRVMKGIEEQIKNLSDMELAELVNMSEERMTYQKLKSDTDSTMLN